MRKSLSVAVILILSFPMGYAVGHSNWTRSAVYEGTNCSWRGTVGIPGVDGTHATGEARHINGDCDMMQADLRRCPSGIGACNTMEYPNGFPASGGSVAGSREAVWVDANTRRNGVWYGFRVNHP